MFKKIWIVMDNVWMNSQRRYVDMKEPLRIDIDEGIMILIWKDGWSFVDINPVPEKDRTYVWNMEVNPTRHGLGRRTLQYLNSIGYKNLEPNVIKGEAYKFWEKMYAEGLIVDIVRLIVDMVRL